MELKIFRDALPAAGGSCTVKAELPLETEILISDYLPPVFKLVKCFAKPVVLQKQLQPGRLSLEGYLRRVCARPSKSSPLKNPWNCRYLILQPGRRSWKGRPNI